MKMNLTFQASTRTSSLRESCNHYFSRRIVRRNRIRDFPLGLCFKEAIHVHIAQKKQGHEDYLRNRYTYVSWYYLSNKIK